jgi:hypothetical protein
MSEADLVECEVWVMVDADGDYAVGSTNEETEERFDDEVGGTAPRRLVKITMRLPRPRAIELVVQVPDEHQGGEAIVTTEPNGGA